MIDEPKLRKRKAWLIASLAVFTITGAVAAALLWPLAQLFEPLVYDSARGAWGPARWPPGVSRYWVDDTAAYFSDLFSGYLKPWWRIVTIRFRSLPHTSGAQPLWAIGAGVAASLATAAWLAACPWEDRPESHGSSRRATLFDIHTDGLLLADWPDSIRTWWGGRQRTPFPGPSFVVNDPKGEIFRATAAWRATLGPVFRLAWSESDGHWWNPIGWGALPGGSRLPRLWRELMARTRAVFSEDAPDALRRMLSMILEYDDWQDRLLKDPTLAVAGRAPCSGWSMSSTSYGRRWSSTSIAR